LDEAGMVDTYLFFSLVKAIDFSRTKFIVMGDPAQVAPVGAGQPFKDLLEMKRQMVLQILHS
jgi:ATP-dependent exoDNAse (exonuclease V) alpha subunit